jgi:hypothetical protein
MINVVLIIASLISMASAKGIFPTVQELESALHAQRGGEIPKQVVTQYGVFTGYYLGATDRGGGRYSVELQLRQ